MAVSQRNIADVHLVAVDELPTLNLEFVGVDLSIYSDIDLIVRLEDGQDFTLAAVIDDAAGGLFHFEWGPGDLVPGVHTADVRFTLSASGKQDTLPKGAPIRLIVRGRV